MKLPWFKRDGLFFIPITFIAWIVLLICIAYAIDVFNDINSWSLSVRNTLSNFAFRLFIIWAVYSFIGFIASRKGTRLRRRSYAVDANDD